MSVESMSADMSAALVYMKEAATLIDDLKRQSQRLPTESSSAHKAILEKANARLRSELVDFEKIIQHFTRTLLAYLVAKGKPYVTCHVISV